MSLFSPIIAIRISLYLISKIVLKCIMFCFNGGYISCFVKYHQPNLLPRLLYCSLSLLYFCKRLILFDRDCVAEPRQHWPEIWGRTDRYHSDRYSDSRTLLDWCAYNKKNCINRFYVFILRQSPGSRWFKMHFCVFFGKHDEINDLQNYAQW